jgi:NitT/TauT family transport system substrate-binding protein
MRRGGAGRGTTRPGSTRRESMGCPAAVRLLSVSLLVLLLAACTGAPAAPAAAPASPAAVAPTAVSSAATASSPVPLPEKVTIAYSSISGTFLPAFLAADEGLFAKYGVNAELTYIGSGTTATQSLLAGEVQFVVTSGGEVAAAYLGGAPTRIILSWMRTLPSIFMVHPSITSPEQLRGQPIGITRFGGQPHTAARLALRGWGLNPDTDVQYLQLGGVAEIMAATLTGQVMGGSYSPPTNVLARKEGLRVLSDPSATGLPYPGSVLTALQPYLEANPEPVRRVVQAMLEGIKVSLTDDAATYASLAKYTRTEDPELLGATVDFYRSILDKAPYQRPEGVRVVLDDLAEAEPRAAAIRPEELIDTSALEQLDRAGFLKQLYGE